MTVYAGSHVFNQIFLDKLKEDAARVATHARRYCQDRLHDLARPQVESATFTQVGDRVHFDLLGHIGTQPLVCHKEWTEAEILAEIRPMTQLMEDALIEALARTTAPR